MLLNTVNFRSNKFKWTSNLHFTRNTNKLIDYPNVDESSFYLSQIGKPFYGVRDVYRFAGVNATTGQYQFYDTHGEPTTTPSNSTPPYYGMDSRIVTYPKFYGGISNSFNYKQLSLDVFFQFTKQLGLNPIYSNLANAGNSRTNQLKDYLTRWQNPGEITRIAKFTTTQISAPVITSDAIYTDASFVRLKNVSLSYTLPINLTNKVNIQKCRVFIQGQNILTFSDYKGLDPEIQSLTNLPLLRVWTMGLQIGL
ncbi:hypothetical protein D3C87_1300110 [compost metagenome]